MSPPEVAAHSPRGSGLEPWWAPLVASEVRRRSKGGGDRDCAPGAPLLVCDRLEDWLRPEGGQHQGLLLRRPPTWGDIQEEVEAAVARGVFGRGDQGIKAKVRRAPHGDFEDIGAVAEDLVSRVGGLPDDIAAVIAADAREIGATLAQLCPWCERIDVKLEILGETCCTRWHRDRYKGRAIVSYNSMATEYTPMSNVNEWELENCGNNDHIIRDKSQICSAGVGDALFIKGSLFPSQVNGLVHKSPEKQYFASGKIINRLVLKLDIP